MKTIGLEILPDFTDKNPTCRSRIPWRHEERNAGLGCRPCLSPCRKRSPRSRSGLIPPKKFAGGGSGRQRTPENRSSRYQSAWPWPVRASASPEVRLVYLASLCRWR